MRTYLPEVPDPEMACWREPEPPRVYSRKTISCQRWAVIICVGAIALVCLLDLLGAF